MGEAARVAPPVAMIQRMGLTAEVPGLRQP